MSKIRVFQILILLTVTCNLKVLSQITEDIEIQFLYSAGGGWDVYQEGDLYGYRIIVYFDGTVELYNNYHLQEMVLEKTGRLSKNKLNRILGLIKKYDFMNYKVGKVNYQKIISPVVNYFIGYRPDNNSEMKLFKVLGGAESKIYPKGYHIFHQKFKNILLSTL